ncbi:MAG: hypothetical protein HY690_03385 [Chloroflexi bacterium]|nr:hypothetical protein [Chloroflexota bacterium]
MLTKTMRVEMTPNRIDVEPGSTPGEMAISIQNTSRVVEQYTTEVVGLPADWYTAPVASVGLFPQDSEQQKITFHPPKRSGVKAGTYPFRVVVRARGGGEEEALDAVLQVRGFAVYRLDLSPRRQTSRGEGVYRMRLSNTGTADVKLRLDARDEEETCKFTLLKEQAVLVQAGDKIEVPLRVQPKRRKLVAPDETYSFTVSARPEGSDDEPKEVTAQYTFRALLPSWAPLQRLAVIGVVIVVGLVAVDALVSTGVATEFPRRVEIAGARIQTAVCGVPVFDRVCGLQAPPRAPVVATPIPQPTPQPTLAPAPTPGPCAFQFGFKDFMDAARDLVGACVTDVSYDSFGNALQHTSKGVLFWQKSTNSVYFFTENQLYLFANGVVQKVAWPDESRS